MLLEFCTQNKFAIMGTMYQLPNHLKTTWQHPRSKHWSKWVLKRSTYWIVSSRTNFQNVLTNRRISKKSYEMLRQVSLVSKRNETQIGSTKTQIKYSFSSKRITTTDQRNKKRLGYTESKWCRKVSSREEPSWILRYTESSLRSYDKKITRCSR